MSVKVGSFLVLLLTLAVLFPPALLNAADHRDAPLIDENPAADITDVYAFLDPNDSSRLVLIMGVNSFAVPAVSGSYGFSPDLLYQFKIDNSGDAVEDFVVQFKFTGRLSGQTVRVFGPSRPQQVGAKNKLLSGVPAVQGLAGATLGDPNGVLVFTGLRDDPFVFDAGQFNRILGGLQDVFRGGTIPVFGAVRGRPLRADSTSGVDAFGGFNASFLVMSFPKSWVRGSTSRVNIWGTVSRGQDILDFSRRFSGFKGSDHARTWVQFERMGQQVINTVFPPRAVKDQFNASIPSHDVLLFSQFVPDALTTTDNDGTGNTIAGRAALLTALNLTTSAGVPLLLPGTFVNTDRNLIRKAVLPDVLRLDLDLAPDDLAIGQFGLQNGRRPNDDGVDIALQLLRQLADVNFSGVPAGTPGSGPPRAGALNFPADRRVFVVLQGTDFIEPDAAATDLANVGNDKALPTTFPFVAAPHPLPGEPGTIGFPPQQ
ncbi:MAG: DUF4331 domain-containing protein [Acidobacteriales bacterium]|nr:DUF4331 domain-containing protein [Terriglobales bacterium]